MTEVDGIKAHQGGKEAHVSFGDVIAHQVAAGGQALFHPIQGVPQALVGLLVGILGASETATIDPVVDFGVDTLHHLVHLVFLVSRPKIRGTFAVEGGPFLGEVLGDLREVVGDHRATFHMDDSGHGDTAGVIGETLEVGILNAFDAQHRVLAIFVQIKDPGAGIVGGAGEAHRDSVL